MGEFQDSRHNSCRASLAVVGETCFFSILWTTLGPGSALRGRRNVLRERGQKKKITFSGPDRGHTNMRGGSSAPTRGEGGRFTPGIRIEKPKKK